MKNNDRRFGMIPPLPHLLHASLLTPHSASSHLTPHLLPSSPLLTPPLHTSLLTLTPPPSHLLLLLLTPHSSHLTPHASSLTSLLTHTPQPSHLTPHTFLTSSASRLTPHTSPHSSPHASPHALPINYSPRILLK